MPQTIESLLPNIGLLIVVAIAFVALKALLGAGKSKVKDYPYDAIKTLFTPAERSFLGVLEQVLDDREYRIFGKVRRPMCSA